MVIQLGRDPAPMLLSLANFEHVVEDAFPIRFGENLAGPANADDVNDTSPLRDEVASVGAYLETRAAPTNPDNGKGETHMRNAGPTPARKPGPMALGLT